MPFRQFATVPALLCVLVYSTVGYTQTSQDDAERAAARDAGYEGIAAFQRGDLSVAVDKLGRAFDVAKVPTLGLWYARALAKTGKLVEAAERYGEVTRLEVSGGKVKEQKQAQADAADELAALRPKIPSLIWTVVGATGNLEVTVNGSPVPNKLMGLPTPMNPGTYQIRAKQQTKVAEQTVTIAEAEKKVVELKFEGSTDSTLSEQADAKTVEQSKSLEAPAAKPSRTGVYIGVAATGIFAAAATVTGVIALGKNKDYDNATDPAEEDSHKKSGKLFALLTDIGIGAAALSAGAAAYFYFTAPKAEPTKAGQIANAMHKRMSANSQASIEFAPVATPNAAGIAVFGKF